MIVRTGVGCSNWAAAAERKRWCGQPRGLPQVKQKQAPLIKIYRRNGAQLSTTLNSGKGRQPSGNLETHMATPGWPQTGLQ